MPLEANRPINRATVVGCAISATPNYLKKGLWQVAASLCQQLSSVNQRISESLTLQRIAPLAVVQSSPQFTEPPGKSSPADGIDPQLLLNSRSFRAFSLSEVKQLLVVMKRWDLPANSMIFTEGSPGGTCFIILSGQVDVSIASRGHQQLLATLQAGSFFGQMSVIDDVPRTATCSTRSDSTLLEIDRPTCRAILGDGSKIAVKFLAALNEELVEALHNSDTRLMELERQHLGLQEAR